MSKVKLTKTEIKDIAAVVMYSGAIYIDFEAFSEVEDILSYEDREAILSAIQKTCNKAMAKIHEKYGEFETSSTTSIVNGIIYE